MFSELGAGVFSYYKWKIHSTKINEGKLLCLCIVRFIFALALCFDLWEVFESFVNENRLRNTVT